jgi:hypothetical protein
MLGIWAWLRCQLCYRGGKRRKVAVKAAQGWTAREQESEAEKPAPYVVAITLFLLAGYITCQGISSLLSED